MTLTPWRDVMTPYPPRGRSVTMHPSPHDFSDLLTAITALWTRLVRQQIHQGAPPYAILMISPFRREDLAILETADAEPR